MLSEGLTEVAFDHLLEGLHSLLFVLTSGPDGDGRALAYSQREYGENALGIDLVIPFAHENGGLELRRRLDESGRWSGVQSYLVSNDQCDLLHVLSCASLKCVTE